MRRLIAAGRLLTADAAHLILLGANRSCLWVGTPEKEEPLSGAELLIDHLPGTRSPLRNPRAPGALAPSLITVYVLSFIATSPIFPSGAPCKNYGALLLVTLGGVRQPLHPYSLGNSSSFIKNCHNQSWVTVVSAAETVRV